MQGIGIDLPFFDFSLEQRCQPVNLGWISSAARRNVVIKHSMPAHHDGDEHHEPKQNGERRDHPAVKVTFVHVTPPSDLEHRAVTDWQHGNRCSRPCTGDLRDADFSFSPGQRSSRCGKMLVRFASLSQSLAP